MTTFRKLFGRSEVTSDCICQTKKVSYFGPSTMLVHMTTLAQADRDEVARGDQASS